MAFVVLTGASASGKTSIARHIARHHAGRLSIFHFDTIGVPSEDEMIATFSSGEEWQRAQPQLIADHTGRWPAYLRADALKRGWPVLDTSSMPIEDSASIVCTYLGM